MNRFYSCLLFFILTSSASFSQALIGDTAQPANPSALLELRTNTKGFLMPRMTTTQRNAIVNPANGLQIYNSTTNCIQIYMPLTGWRDMVCDCQNPPVATFTYSPNTPGMGSPVTFTPTTPGLTYSWTFQSGNPATSTAQNPSVTWSSPGTYTVTLTVTNQQGCSSTQTSSIVVSNCPPGTQTFSYTGAQQTFTVPGCVTTIHIRAWGAQGSAGATQFGFNGGAGALGGLAEGDLAVTPGSTINIFVGGQAGYNGGGTGGNSGGGVGGGASDVRVGGIALNNRVIVGGGGGGGGAAGCTDGSGGNPFGGDGGGGGGGTGVTGGTTTNGGPGGGGAPGVGGAQGVGCSCCLGQVGAIGGTGGQGTNCCCGSGGPRGAGGGGGGGFTGGGGGGGGSAGTTGCGGNSIGGGGGGGGGSSYTGGVTNGTTQQGVQSGNGQIIISW